MTIVTIPKIKKLNILPSVRDERDKVFKAKKTKTPDAIDLREFDSVVEDQGFLGSCVGNAICNAYELQVNVLYPGKFSELSRLFVYYHSRFFNEGIAADEGSYLRDGLKAAKNYGVCTEALWPYDVTKFDAQPTPKCYLDGYKRTITNYETLYTNEEMMEVLAAKKPIVVAIELFDQFLNISKADPVVKMPAGYGYSLGYHAVSMVGYDATKKMYLFKNSWGSSWGDNGYAWIPFDYIDTLAIEKWCFDISNQNTIT